MAAVGRRPAGRRPLLRAAIVTAGALVLALVAFLTARPEALSSALHVSPANFRVGADFWSLHKRDLAMSHANKMAKREFRSAPMM